MCIKWRTAYINKEDSQCTYVCNIDVRSSHSERVCVYSHRHRCKQCACAILSSSAWPAVQYFSTFSHKRHDFRKKMFKCLWTQNVCFDFSLQLLSEAFPILRRTERDLIRSVNWFSCTVPVILVRFSWKLNFLDRNSKNTQISNFLKFRPLGAELFHADGRTDVMKLIIAFRNFTKAPKKQ